MLRAAVNENIASINLCYVLSNLNLYKTDKNLHLPFFFFFLCRWWSLHACVLPIMSELFY